MKVKFVFAWYDLYVGLYIDRKNRCVYIMIPTIGIKLLFGVKDMKIDVINEYTSNEGRFTPEDLLKTSMIKDKTI